MRSPDPGETAGLSVGTRCVVGSSMAGSSKKPETPEAKDSRLHMANERTFLAWIRTSIGIMIFGFVIERFAVPSGSMPPAGTEAPAGEAGHLVILGICLVLLGVLASLLATYRFIRIQRQILAGTYRPSVVRYVLLAVLLGSIGIIVALGLAQRMNVF